MLKGPKRFERFNGDFAVRLDPSFVEVFDNLAIGFSLETQLSPIYYVGSLPLLFEWRPHEHQFTVVRWLAEVALPPRHLKKVESVAVRQAIHPISTEIGGEPNEATGVLKFSSLPGQ